MAGDVKARTNTRSWDAVGYLESDEDMAAYLRAALEEGDASLVAAALGDIAWAKSMTQIAEETCLGCESLYRVVSPEEELELATVLEVVRALVLRPPAKGASPDAARR